MSKAYKINANNLILEVTRRCNMACAHCLRGDAWDEDISGTTLENVFKQIGVISTLTFTGGEPSLVPGIMLQALEYCRQYGVPVMSAYLVTNGKQVTDEFLNACDQWHEYTMSCSYNMGKMVKGRELEKQAKWFLQKEEMQGMQLSLSADSFHGEIPVKNLVRLTSRSYFRDDKFSTEFFDNGSYIVAEGRALDNISPMRLNRVKTPETELEVELDGDRDVCVDEMYVNVYGDVLPDCDFSYMSQDEYALYNMNTCNVAETLYKKLKSEQDYLGYRDQWEERGETK